MKLTLERFEFTDHSTIGRLLINGELWCYTLEDTDRKLEDGGIKLPGKTAIPRGTYEIRITHSPRFKRELPLLVDVPEFSGVRIHPGNKPEDTEGCILVGSSYREDWVFNSRATFNSLFALLDEVYREGGELELEIL